MVLLLLIINKSNCSRHQRAPLPSGLSVWEPARGRWLGLRYPAGPDKHALKCYTSALTGATHASTALAQPHHVLVAELLVAAGRTPGPFGCWLPGLCRNISLCTGQSLGSLRLQSRADIQQHACCTPLHGSGNLLLHCASHRLATRVQQMRLWDLPFTTTASQAAEAGTMCAMAHRAPGLVVSAAAVAGG